VAKSQLRSGREKKKPKAEKNKKKKSAREGEPAISASRSIAECLLFGAPIEPNDAGLLCVHFQPKSMCGEESSPLRSAERTHD
jgi:hypothetical protein